MKTEKKLLLQVADIGFLIKWSHPPMQDKMDKCYNGFIHSAGIKKVRKKLAHVCTINVHGVNEKHLLPNHRDAQKILSIPKFWTLYKKDGRYLMESFHPV